MGIMEHMNMSMKPKGIKPKFEARDIVRLALTENSDESYDLKNRLNLALAFGRISSADVRALVDAVLRQSDFTVVGIDLNYPETGVVAYDSEITGTRVKIQFPFAIEEKWLRRLKRKFQKPPYVLIPPDRERCQAEKPNGATAFSLGGVPDLVRCGALPSVIITEKKSDAWGRKGSMSLCLDCLEVAERQGVLENSTLKKIKNHGNKNS